MTDEFSQQALRRLMNNRAAMEPIWLHSIAPPAIALFRKCTGIIAVSISRSTTRSQFGSSSPSAASFGSRRPIPQQSRSDRDGVGLRSGHPVHRTSGIAVLCIGRKRAAAERARSIHFTALEAGRRQHHPLRCRRCDWHHSRCGSKRPPRAPDVDRLDREVLVGFAFGSSFSSRSS